MPLMAQWFDGFDPITSAHQHLLEGDTANSFISMVEAWQQNEQPNKHRNLTALLSLAISEDCGRSLSKKPLPSWIKKLVIRRESVQTSSRIYYNFSIYGQAEDMLSELSFFSWVTKSIHVKKLDDSNAGYFKYGFEGLSENVKEGLYKLTIKSKKGQSWSSWILITEPDSIRKISWLDSTNWRIAPELNLKNICPNPTLLMEIYKSDATQHEKVWSMRKDNHLPTSLPDIDIPEGEYWFTVALIENRWQGAVLFEEIQSIGRDINSAGVDDNSQTP